MKAKKKICPTCGEEKYLWNKKVGCKECVAKNKKTPISRKTGNNLKRTPIKKVGDKKAKRDAIYSVLRKKYLEDKPKCEICGTSNSTDIHHTHAGADRAKYQNDVSTWMALCRGCHSNLHQHPSWARENGYLE